ncbi:hypothetical protein G7K_2523-t1 [Saitoella complicata NRRL Y-17804]|uniref:BAG domain-containing protein n=1 Tax=Saitoella complicata (strain BCRC 22490 / CBS 7301 / JCM 7358 / NBRC 10748 / NRRL Y-17804) TaxID=698492 RepID=A0A0E9NG17_SAICN|nr:hypothetical protein G7K_2523-t1 [Saitoella complicata NRRL Y-17804]
MKAFFNSMRGHPTGGHDYVTVAHGKDRYHFEFPDDSIDQGEVTVAQVKRKCAEASGCDLDRINLLFGGTSLKKPDATLAQANIRSGSKILMMASKATPQAPPKAPTPTPKAVPPTPKTPSEQIDHYLNETNTLYLPAINAFCSNPPSDEKKRKDTHLRLSETILGRLLMFDGIDVSEDGTGALRQKRKDAVKYTQGLLDRLDRAVKGKKESEGGEVDGTETQA